MSRKNVLIVVDYQNDFVNGALGFKGAEKLDAGIAELVKQYMNNDDIVIYTADTHYENYMDTQEGKILPIVHCIEGSDGWQFYGETGEAYHREYDKGTMLLLSKETFGSHTLMRKLMKYNEDERGIPNQIESITLVGVVTNMCVISNAVIAKAACPEAKIVIKENLVASFDNDMHNKALDVMKSMQMFVE